MSQDDLVKEHFHKMGQDGSYAAFYGDRSHKTHDFFARKARVEEFLVSHMRPGQSVLDVGCGTGPMVDFFCSRGLHYCGLDVAQGMLDSISRQFSNAPYKERIELQIGSSESRHGVAGISGRYGTDIQRDCAGGEAGRTGGLDHTQSHQPEPIPHEKRWIYYRNLPILEKVDGR